MPLKLVFILMAAVAVNLMLIESFKILLLFDHADNLEAANLAAIDSRYANCTVIDTYTDKDENTPFWENYFTFHLLETANGERLLAVVENHFRHMKTFEERTFISKGIQSWLMYIKTIFTMNNYLRKKIYCWIGFLS